VELFCVQEEPIGDAGALAEVRKDWVLGLSLSLSTAYLHVVNGFLWIVWIVAIIAIAIWAFGFAKRRRMTALKEAGPLSDEDRGYLDDHFDLYEKIPAEVRTRLEPLVQVLMAEKNFEACGDLEEVTREMKVVIMAQAALLLVGRNHRFFSKLRTVLLYPDAFSGGRMDDETVRLGESWESGSVILSWRSVQRGGEDERDGRNVVIHEFAHQLDQENRHADGLPELENRAAIGNWAHAFSAAYEDFCKDLDAGRKTVMDPYGATNPAEFFAVATETFFEKAKQLNRDYPELYEQLKRYYGLSPMDW
jgi:Mlc titration factor MtfA (ptsG expression regulator)